MNHLVQTGALLLAMRMPCVGQVSTSTTTMDTAGLDIALPLHTPLVATSTSADCMFDPLHKLRLGFGTTRVYLGAHWQKSRFEREVKLNVASSGIHEGLKSTVQWPGEAPPTRRAIDCGSGDQCSSI